MCVLFSTIALASLYNSCGSFITIVILLRCLLHQSGLTLAITLPHVALLHSVTSLQYKGPDLVGEVFPILSLSSLSLSLPYQPKSLTSLRILTHYSLYSTSQFTTTFTFTLPYSQVIPPAQTH